MKKVTKIANSYSSKNPNQEGSNYNQLFNEEVDFHIKTVKVDSLDHQHQRHEKDLETLGKELAHILENVPNVPANQIAEQIANACETTDGKIRRRLNQQKFNVENTKSFCLAKLDHLSSKESLQINKTSLILDQATKQRVEEESNIELTPLLNDYDLATKTAKEREIQLKEVIRVEYENKPPVYQSVLRNNFLYGICFMFLCFADSIFTYTALQRLTEALPNYMAMIMSLMLGMCIAVSAHFLGKTTKGRNSYEFRTILLIVASLFLVIVLLRSDTGAAIELTILNASILGLAGFLSYWRHRYDSYWNLKETVVHWREKAAKLYVSISKVKHQYKDSARLTKLAAEKEHHSKLQKERTILEAKILACNKWIDGLDSLYAGYKEQIQEIKRASLNQTRKQVAQRRQNKESFFDTLPKFNGYPNISDQFQLPIFALALLFISSCSPAPTMEGLVLVDKTISHEGYQSPLGADVFPLFSTMESGRIKFVPVIDQHMQPHWWVAKENKSYFTRVEAKADSAKVKFRNDFNDAFHALPPPSEFYKKTLFFSAIESHMVPLSLSKADKKRVVIISDLLENSDTFNFYRFRSNPASIMENYDLILARFDNEFADQSTMNLTGVEILIVHSPHRENDQLYYYVTQWWQRYFNSKGAHVQIMSSLDGASLTFSEN